MIYITIKTFVFESMTDHVNMKFQAKILYTDNYIKQFREINRRPFGIFTSTRNFHAPLHFTATSFIRRTLGFLISPIHQAAMNFQV